MARASASASASASANSDTTEEPLWCSSRAAAVAASVPGRALTALKIGERDSAAVCAEMAAATSLQMHLQHSPRKKNFGYEETIRLLELWTHYTNGGTHPELGKGHRTGRLWLVISERMKAMNYNRGPEECKVRVGNLRAKYTKLKRGYLAGNDDRRRRPASPAFSDPLPG